MKRTFTFPGQGSQYVGMGKSLVEAFPVARDVFAEVDEALGVNLSRLMFEGPEDELRLTENAQPALMAVSLAVMRVLESGGVTLAAAAEFAAGHSLGEYSALAAAESLQLADTAKLLRLRGQAMQRAVPVGEGAMAALLGLDFEGVSALHFALRRPATREAGGPAGGGQNEAHVYFSRTRQPVRRHGKIPGRGLSGGQGCLCGS